MVMVCDVAWCKMKQDTKFLHPETETRRGKSTQYTCTIWGNCEHWWVQKGKDDLADISVIFFLYGLVLFSIYSAFYVLCSNDCLLLRLWYFALDGSWWFAPVGYQSPILEEYHYSPDQANERLSLIPVKAPTALTAVAWQPPLPTCKETLLRSLQTTTSVPFQEHDCSRDQARNKDLGLNLTECMEVTHAYWS